MHDTCDGWSLVFMGTLYLSVEDREEDDNPSATSIVELSSALVKTVRPKPLSSTVVENVVNSFANKVFAVGTRKSLYAACSTVSPSTTLSEIQGMW